MALLDLVNYRDTGELSDITIVVDDQELPLHKFPLYIRSEYFKEQAKEDRVELSDFPGGADCFGLIADFCYNKRIDISLENVVRLRCGAEYLRMQGRDNLCELTDRYLDDVINSSQLGRSIAPIVDLLTEAAAMGEAGGQSKVADKCFGAILDMWSRPAVNQSPTAERLLQLPLDTFEHLVKNCGENERQRRPLADVVCRYLQRVFQHENQAAAAEEQQQQQQQQQQQEPERDEPQQEAEAADEEEKEDPPKKEEADEDEAGQAGSDTEADTKQQKKPQQQQQQQQQQPKQKEEPKEFLPKEPAAEVLDRIILNLPEQTPLSEVINGDWIRQALQICEQQNCECRSKLLQLAGNILHRFRQEELKQMPSPVLCDIVSTTVSKENVEPEVLSCVIDNHLLDLAKAGNLTAEDFVKLAGSVPNDYRSSHDTLYEVAEVLLTSGDGIPDDQQKDVIEAIDLSRCEETTLQRALDKGAVPAKVVCQAAIDLARRLKQQQPEADKGVKRDDLRSKYLTPSRHYEPSRPITSSSRFYGSSPSASVGIYGTDSFNSRYDDYNAGGYDDTRYGAGYESYTDDRGHRLNYQTRYPRY